MMFCLRAFFSRDMSLKAKLWPAASTAKEQQLYVRKDQGARVCVVGSAVGVCVVCVVRDEVFVWLGVLSADVLVCV